MLPVVLSVLLGQLLYLCCATLTYVVAGANDCETVARDYVYEHLARRRERQRRQARAKRVGGGARTKRCDGDTILAM